jgi:hypothetical protein
MRFERVDMTYVYIAVARLRPGPARPAPGSQAELSVVVGMGTDMGC